MRESPFGSSRHKWREVTGEPGAPLLVRHDYAILGYDLAAGTLDAGLRVVGLDDRLHVDDVGLADDVRDRLRLAIGDAHRVELGLELRLERQLRR